jgi:hypothetical protein
MNSNAVPQTSLKARFLLAPLAAVMLLAFFGATATAASPVGKDGQIHACYRVKGKPKGSIRIVPSAKRCKRGERKVVWSVAGSGGQTGAAAGQAGAGQAESAGQAGATGQQGQAGTNGSPNEAVLKTEISSLTVKLDALESILGGITHNDLLNLQTTLGGLTNGELLGSVDAVKGLTSGDLTGAVDAVDGLTNGDLKGAVGAVSGLTNTDLTNAVASLPVVDSLCTQSEGLTEQVNKVGKGVSEISLGGILPGGLTLKLPTLAPLPGFTC